MDKDMRGILILIGFMIGSAIFAAILHDYGEGKIIITAIENGYCQDMHKNWTKCK